MIDHDHYPLDGKLHDDEGCPMCIEIRARQANGKREDGADQLAHHYAQQANRKRR